MADEKKTSVYVGPPVGTRVSYRERPYVVSATRCNDDGADEVSFDGGLSYVPAAQVSPWVDEPAAPSEQVSEVDKSGS